jgi:hypothetical protein
LSTPTPETPPTPSCPAPLAKLERWKTKKGWTIPWYSTNDGDFSYDFCATIDASRGYDEYNHRTLDEYAAKGHESMKTAAQPYDMPGRMCFLAVDGTVFRTYSVYARGLESTGGSHYFLNLTARTSKGLGAARWPYRQRPRQPARLRVLTDRPTGHPKAFGTPRHPGQTARPRHYNSPGTNLRVRQSRPVIATPRALECREFPQY